MTTEKSQEPLASASAPVITSCRRKKSDNTSFVQDVRDHIHEFINASVDEHKTCLQKTISKMFGMSKVVAQRNANNKEVESTLFLQSSVSD